MKRQHTYSQHFLRNPNFVKELIGHSSIKKRDTVLDIGAGSGSITSVLANRVSKAVAIETEAQTVQLLQKNMQRHDNVQIIHADVMDVDLPSTPYKVFANIPFHLSADIVRKLCFSDHVPEDIFLIVQKQFAKKLRIDPHSFTAMLGAQLAPWFTCSIKRTLRKTDFWPHPNVDTVLLRIKPHEKPFIAFESQTAYCSFIERCYHDQVYFSTLTRRPKNKRPSELSTEQWLTLFAYYS